ncbi:hypothetical protein LBYZC6_43990 [Lacrimispora brassicae]
MIIPDFIQQIHDVPADDNCHITGGNYGEKWLSELWQENQELFGNEQGHWGKQSAGIFWTVRPVL